MGQSASVLTYRQLHWRHSSNIVLIGELLLLVLAGLSLVSVDVNASSAKTLMYVVLAYGGWLICAEGAAMAGRMNFHLVVTRTWMMAAFVICIMWYTDGLFSPLRNGVLIAILVSALSVGKANSLLLILLLFVNTLVLVHHGADDSVGFAAVIGETVARITPQAIVAYLVATFGMDLRYRLSSRFLDSGRCPGSGLLDANGLAIELARLYGELRRSREPLCALIVTLDAGITDPANGDGRVAEAISLLSSNIFLEMSRSDVAGRYGNDAVLILLRHAVREDCMALERKLRDIVDVEAIRQETGLRGLELHYKRIFVESAPRGIDAMLSTFDAEKMPAF